MQDCVDELKSFPLLADAEFEGACSALLKTFDLHGHRQAEWSAVERVSQSEFTYLRINKPLFESLDAGGADDDEEIELREEDDEVAETPTLSRAALQYDIVLSPTYRVPVLYFFILDTLHRYPLTLETLYSVMIPPTFRAQAEHVGVIGGITITVGLSRGTRVASKLMGRQDHPVTNKPVFFIHPCRTAEVMQAISGGHEISGYNYLLLWIGALGKCVGLNVPLVLVDAVGNDV